MGLTVIIDPADSSRLIFSQPVTLKSAIAYLWANPPVSSTALRPDPTERAVAGGQRRFIIDKSDLDLAFSLRHGLANQYVQRVKPIMAKGPATLPNWVPKDVRDKILAFKMPSGAHRFPGAHPWGDVVVWIQQGGHLHVQVYQEYPSGMDYYLGITHGDERDARLLHHVYTQYNSDMKYFVEQKRLSPENARDEIRRINDEVFKLVIEGAVAMLSAGAGVSALNQNMRTSAPRILDAARRSKSLTQSAGQGVRVALTQNETTAIGRLQAASLENRPGRVSAEAIGHCSGISFTKSSSLSRSTSSKASAAS